MEELTNLMRLIDLNSMVIPEGNYLEMCNSIKKVHESISRTDSNNDSETDEDEEFILRNIMTDDTRGIPVPFSPIRTERGNRYRYYENADQELQNADADAPSNQGGNRDDGDDVLMADADELDDMVTMLLPEIQVPREMLNDQGFIRDMRRLQMASRHGDEAEIRRLDIRIDQIQRLIRNTKPRQRITANVRTMAVKKRASDIGIRLSRYTIGNLLDKGHNVGNEREFYKAYLDEYNKEIEYKLKDLNDDLFETIRDKDSLLEEMNLFLD